MERVPEPELMDGPEQAAAYAQADFESPNSHFVELFHSHVGVPAGPVLDLGCGPGDIPLRLARAYADVRVDAVDGAAAMLEHARSALAAAPDCADRVRFIRATLPDHGLASGAYDAIVSNSLLHHLHDPSALWDTVKRVAAPGARVLVMDLFRPTDPDAAAGIVATYAAGEPEVLRRDFYNSLFAAFTPDEVRAQLQRAGLDDLDVTTVSDRHLLVQGQLP